jgi:hypothetical protein
MEGNLLFTTQALAREHPHEIIDLILEHYDTQGKSREQLAFFDPLTRLPNRRLLDDRVEQAMALFRHHGRRGALLFIPWRLDDGIHAVDAPDSRHPSRLSVGGCGRRPIAVSPSPLGGEGEKEPPPFDCRRTVD